MLLVIKPLVMTMWRSRAFKELIVAMLEKIVTRTDNDLDDLAVKHLKELLLPDTQASLRNGLVQARVFAGQWLFSSLDTALAQPLLKQDQAIAVTGVLSLLPFFQFFRGTPHQLAAIKQLEESMPARLLEENEADWFQAWKESGYDQQIYMPYFRQWDNKTKTGYRECFQLGCSHGGGVLQEGSYG